MRRPRPVQDVRIWSIQHRPSKPKPHGVRWVVDGEPHSRWRRTQGEADRFRARLVTALQDGEWFDRRSGEPESWRPAADELQVFLWARQWVRDEWTTWAPRTRQRAIEALERFLPLVCDPKVPEPPAGLRTYLRSTLPPDADIDPDHKIEKWLHRWGLSLGELTEGLLADADRRLGIGVTGRTLASSTASGYRKVSKACVRRAVELKRLPADPWPPTPKGRSKRKASRQPKAVDIKRLPDPATMAEIIMAIRSHQPGSRNYQMMTAVTYWAGLRPSETAMLRPRILHLPEDGWGEIHVIEADDGWDEPAEPKTGERRVPIPPHLVRMLRDWTEEVGLTSDDLLFRTRNGRRPSQSNWNRALKRACRKVGYRDMCPYDARHACATTWLQAGVALGEAARRLGHSVETLVSYYVGALDGDDLVANELIATAAHRAAAPRVTAWMSSWAA